MMTTWSQSEDSFDDESENEFANMCFMAFEDQDKVNSNSDSDDDISFEYDEFVTPPTPPRWMKGAGNYTRTLYLLF